MPGFLGGCLGLIAAKPNDARIDGRLGKRDLGHYAYEDKMPDWLHRLLEDEEKLQLERAPSGISTILEGILEQDHDVETAYLCHPAVRYIGKVRAGRKDEGNNFCGYHNIQMLISYINSTDAQGCERLAGGIPTIGEIQSMIEAAWDQGFNESGRLQTGGIKGTRKHIGTPEAQALLRSLKIPCKSSRFQTTSTGATAHEHLLDDVEHYFSTSTVIPQSKTSPKVQSTAHPPIYLQRPRHSMTIIGIEKRKNGRRNLLVFDPAYHPSKDMMRMLSADSEFKPSSLLVKPYRRGEKYLRRFAAFEILCLVPDA